MEVKPKIEAYKKEEKFLVNWKDNCNLMQSEKGQ